MRIALVHEWFVSQRGGENVVDAFCEAFPEAPLYSLIHKPGSVSPRLEDRQPRTSWLQWVPGIFSRYRYFLPLMPLAIRTLRLPSKTDVVLSSSHCVAKGVSVPKGARHICYIHAPMRYMWDRFDEYFGSDRAGFFVRAVALIFRPLLQAWDRRSSKSVDTFVANSHFIAERVRVLYGREAQVLHPFVELDYFNLDRGEIIPGELKSVLCPYMDCDRPSSYYLVVSALVPYKRVDLAVEAIAQSSQRRLFIVGDGPERSRLEALVEKFGCQQRVVFLGPQSGESLRWLYQHCSALLFPGIEDFGIVPLEAMACGRPVVALGQGGALETVVDGKTGLFFKSLSRGALDKALQQFESMGWDPLTCRRRAEDFSRQQFLRNIQTIVRDEGA